MRKSYAVVFQNQRSGKVGMDRFTAISPGAAKKRFFRLLQARKLCGVERNGDSQNRKRIGGGQSDFERP